MWPPLVSFPPVWFSVDLGQCCFMYSLFFLILTDIYLFFTLFARLNITILLDNCTGFTNKNRDDGNFVFYSAKFNLKASSVHCTIPAVKSCSSATDSKTKAQLVHVCRMCLHCVLPKSKLLSTFNANWVSMDAAVVVAKSEVFDIPTNFGFQKASVQQMGQGGSFLTWRQQETTR